MGLKQYTILYEIQDGWSEDKKYCAEQNGTLYFIRINPKYHYKQEKTVFETIQQLAKTNPTIVEPIEFGIEKDTLYSVWQWIDGKDLRTCINTYSKNDQYTFGLTMGKTLQQIHSVKSPDDLEQWSTRFNKKLDRNITWYLDCELSYPKGQLFIDYIQAQRHLLQDVEQVFQHGDFHIGNMMVDNDNNIYLIDFNRFDYGAPWEEFNRIIWSAQSSSYFASGLIDGYFNHQVPLEFWKLLCLYISSNAISSLPWSIPFGEDEVQVMQELANRATISKPFNS